MNRWLKLDWMWFLFLLSALSACFGSLANDSSIDADRIMAHVEKIVSYGPHPPGSEAQKEVAAYIESQLDEMGLTVRTQPFEAVTPIGRKEMKNIWAEVPGREESIILLASHYDSKYFEEFEFVGANDSGSSSAVLLEFARILAAENPIPQTIWIAFFDGEEAFGPWTNADSLYGSRQFVSMLKKNQKLKSIKTMILLDLVGGKEMALRKDVNSTYWLSEVIWGEADRMGLSDLFVPFGNTTAIDDHIPFLEEGIPAVDIIDLAYPYWHTPEDTPDKLSPEKMKAVGDVVLGSLPRIAERLR